MRAYAGEGPLNTDDNALIEFSAPREIHLETVAENSGAIAGAARGVAGYLDGPWASSRDRARFLNALATRALAGGEWRQAELAARDAIDLVVSAEGLWLLGEALYRRGQETEALRFWRETVAVEPKHVGALLSLALDHHARGGFDEAEPYVASLAGLGADDSMVNFLLGVTCYRRGLYHEALAFLARAAAGQPGRANSTARLVASLWGIEPGPEELALYYVHLVHARLGNRRAEQETWTRLVEALDRWRRELERRSPGSPNLYLMESVRLRSERGIRLPEDAHLSEVLARQVLEPLTRYYEGVTAYLLGYPEVAAAELEAALTRLGDAAPRSRARYYLGLAYWKLGRLAPARHHLEGFLEHLDGQDRQSLAAAEAARTLASIYVTQGQREAATKLERRAEDILRTRAGR